ncbi:MAG: hypothetical protein ACLUOI_32910 [Eisenbergiella sp.]
MEFFKTHKNLVTAVCAVASIAVAVVAGKDLRFQTLSGSNYPR